jgi:hypothetical protein
LSRSTTWTAVGVLAVAAAALTGCSGGSSEDVSAFEWNAVVNGNSDQIIGTTGCKFADHTLSVGDPVIVYGADGTILGKGNLERDSIEASNVVYCSLKVAISGIKAGENAYKVQIGAYSPVIASEAEMVRDPALFSARNSLERVWGEPPLKVAAPMTGESN